MATLGDLLRLEIQTLNKQQVTIFRRELARVLPGVIAEVGSRVRQQVPELQQPTGQKEKFCKEVNKDARS
jgi:hypothetical protein